MPAFGGLTIRARWPLPIGSTRLISRWLRFFGSVSRLISSSGMDRGQVAEDRAAAGRLGVDAVDGIDPEHAPVLLAFARGADRAGDAVADAEAEAADLARADVDVVRAGQQPVAAQEAEALVDDVEDAARVGVAGALGLALEDLVDEVVLALGRVPDRARGRGRPARSSATLISRRSLTSRSFRSRAASSSCCSSNSETGARPPPPTGLRRRGRRLRER